MQPQSMTGKDRAAATRSASLGVGDLTSDAADRARIDEVALHENSGGSCEEVDKRLSRIHSINKLNRGDYDAMGPPYSVGGLRRHRTSSCLGRSVRGCPSQPVTRAAQLARNNQSAARPAASTSTPPTQGSCTANNGPQLLCAQIVIE